MSWKIRKGIVSFTLFFITIIYIILVGLKLETFNAGIILTLLWLLEMGFGNKEPSIIQMRITKEEIVKLEENLTVELKRYIDQLVIDGQTKSDILTQIFDEVDEELKTRNELKKMIV